VTTARARRAGLHPILQPGRNVALLTRESLARSPDAPVERPQSFRLPCTTLPQPDETTCGPTCLHAVYNFFGNDEPLGAVVERMWRLEHGGTYAVYLACDALRNGYRARIYTYNLTVFDPTWFTAPGVDLADKLTRQRDVKDERRGQHVIDGYLEFLALGGRLRFANLSEHLIHRILGRRLPILAGLSSTYLYRSARELDDGTPDDVRGYPVGHFVVIAGWDARLRRVMVVDPYQPNPWGPSHEYWIGVDRVVAAILLGIVTHDANLLVVYPKARAALDRKRRPH
jgi:hypothetical protein